MFSEKCRGTSAVVLTGISVSVFCMVFGQSVIGNLHAKENVC